MSNEQTNCAVSVYKRCSVQSSAGSLEICSRRAEASQLRKPAVGFHTSGAATIACHAFSVKLAWEILFPLCIRTSRAARPERLQVVLASCFDWHQLSAVRVRPGRSVRAETSNDFRETSAADGSQVLCREAARARWVTRADLDCTDLRCPALPGSGTAGTDDPTTCKETLSVICRDYGL
jgi:hypothetical protein